MVELSKASTISSIQGLPVLKSILKESESQHIIFKEVEKSSRHMEVITIQCHREEESDLDQVTVIQIQELEVILYKTRVLKVDLRTAVFF